MTSWRVVYDVTHCDGGFNVDLRGFLGNANGNLVREFRVVETALRWNDEVLALGSTDGDVHASNVGCKVHLRTLKQTGLTFKHLVHVQKQIKKHHPRNRSGAIISIDRSIGSKFSRSSIVTACRHMIATRSRQQVRPPVFDVTLIASKT